MSEEEITVVIAKVGVLMANGNMLSETAGRQIAAQLAERFPGCVVYNEETQEVIYTGPKCDLGGAPPGTFARLRGD